MLITESQLGNFGSSLSLLENMEYLSESESAYYPAMVPVVENSSLNAAVIKIEDLTSYAEANGIVDLGYALQTVCEASDIDPSAVVFSVQEENIIADQDTADLVAGIMNEGVGVVAVPISDSNPACWLAEQAIEYAAYNGDYSLLEAFANDDMEVLAEFVRDETNTIGPKSEGSKNRYINGSGTVDKLSYDISGGPAGGKVKSASGHSEQGRIMKTLRWIRMNAINKPRHWLAQKIAALNKKAAEWAEKAKNASPGDKGIFNTIKQKISELIAWLTGKLKNVLGRGGVSDVQAKPSKK